MHFSGETLKRNLSEEMLVSDMIKKCKSILSDHVSNEKNKILNLNNILNEHQSLNNLKYDEYQSINIKNNTSTPLKKLIGSRAMEDNEIYYVGDSSSSCSSDELVIVDNSDHEDGVYNVSQLADITMPNLNETSETESNLNQ